MEALKLSFSLKTTTKTCYRFEHREGAELTTLYLKKSQVDSAGIDPNKGIAITIEQEEK
ncbi:hypothetical protein [Yanshouia hominis]|uniref:Uncharacterized protein n=1 Tax=Yanshouia hominis TaxID=2763673 RepID=A0ABR7NHG8_9FIRM|nr:hypothetical protein [Yanshouia hominis]MBC8575851.1 hypothetical protein [Yanshouia hominis]